jgi:hypothetical protein
MIAAVTGQRTHFANYSIGPLAFPDHFGPHAWLAWRLSVHVASGGGSLAFKLSCSRRFYSHAARGYAAAP